MHKKGYTGEWQSCQSAYIGKAKQDFHVYYCHIGSESMQVFFPLKVATFVTLTQTVHMLMAPRTASVREDTLAMDSHAEVP